MDFFKRAENEFDCPKCNAEKGMPCRTPTGRKAKTPHNDRQWKVVLADRSPVNRKRN